MFEGNLGKEDFKGGEQDKDLNRCLIKDNPMIDEVKLEKDFKKKKARHIQAYAKKMFKQEQRGWGFLNLQLADHMWQ